MLTCTLRLPYGVAIGPSAATEIGSLIDTNGAEVTPTFAAGDVKITQDDGSGSDNIDTLPSLDGANIRLQLSAAEMTVPAALGGVRTVGIKDQDGPVWLGNVQVRIETEDHPLAFDTKGCVLRDTSHASSQTTTNIRLGADPVITIRTGTFFRVLSGTGAGQHGYIKTGVAGGGAGPWNLVPYVALDTALDNTSIVNYYGDAKRVPAHVVLNEGTIATLDDLDTAQDAQHATSQASLTTLLARITSTLFSGITSLSQWLGLLAGKQTGNSTARTELRATGAGSGTFDETTDSLEGARDTAQQTLLDRLTATRAGYLDNLNIGGAAASQADVLALNQSASRRVMLATVATYERPESGSTVYTVEARTYDGDGAAVNADSTPTLTATGQTSGSLAANLGAASNPATGLYRWTYTVAAAATIEPVRFDLSATIGGSTFTLSTYTQIADFVAATWTTADRTKLDTLHDTRLTAARAAALDNLDATMSSRATPAQVNQEADTALADVGLTPTVTGRIDVATSTRATPGQVNTEADQALADAGVNTTVTGRIDVAVSSRAAPGVQMTLSAAEREAAADAWLARHQKGGANGPPEQSVAAALAGGMLRFTIVDGVITVLHADGTTAYARTLTREELNAIASAVP